MIHLENGYKMTNVLLIPDYFKQSQVLQDRAVNDSLIEKLIMQDSEIERAEDILARPKVISEIQKDYLYMKQMNMADLVCRPN